MPAAAVNQVYRVTFNGFLHNQRTMTTFYYKLLDLPGAGGNHDDASNDLNTRIATAGDLQSLYRACCPSNWTLDSLWIQLIYPTRVRKIVYNKNLAGTGANASTVTNVSASITRTGVLAARNQVGGIRVPISPADCAAGLLTTTPFANLGALSVKMKALYGAAADWWWSPGFMSKVPGQQPNERIPAFTEMYAAFPQETSRVVRRRTVGLGI